MYVAVSNNMLVLNQWRIFNYKIDVSPLPEKKREINNFFKLHDLKIPVPMP